MFDLPIKRKKVRKDLYADIYANGVICIDGIRYVMHSFTSAKRTHCKNYPVRNIIKGLKND